jgi:hypothetical protein
MKTLKTELALFVARTDVRSIFVLATIALFIIGAGAPDASGGIGLR